MPNWNPSFPEVLGNQWLANIGHNGRVYAGAPALMARLESTTTETIGDLKLSATVNPLVDASIPTLIDIVEEGNEDIGLFSIVRLNPNSDTLNTGWTTGVGGTTGLWDKINDDTSRWTGPATTGPGADWIQSVVTDTYYECSFDATQFAVAQPLVNARIGDVSIRAIMGANTGYRKLKCRLNLGGTYYDPAGGGLRDVHQNGAINDFRWGEINPATSRPWTPADIANFGTGGTYRVRLASRTASVSQFPMVWAMQMWVHYITVENRAAVGIWRRPEDIGTNRLLNVDTDDVRTVPSGIEDWSKLSGRNYLFYWRQSVSPSEYGATVADDVRWNMAYQLLPSDGQPPGYSFTPDGNFATQRIAHDQFGRPTAAFASTASASSIGSAAGLVLIRTDFGVSVDSQPYRLDVTDLEEVTSTQKLGQRVTPGASDTYLGVRLPIIPPASGNPTLTVAVHRVSDGVQMGGTFTITATAARALPSVTGGWRYIHGFLSSGAALVSGTAYEIRLTSTSGGTWIASMPDASLGNAASFGGSTNGGFIGATHFTDRELAVALVRQPNPPTGLTAVLTNIAITSYAAEATTIQHVRLTWAAPASGMGGLFARYEIERQLDASGVWERIANVVTSTVVTFDDHEVPRSTVATYRIRAVGTDGRFSAWATSGNVTPTTTGSLVILTSNHIAGSEVVYIHDRESSYPVLSVDRDEYIAIHGADYQVAFMEAEDRGIGWRTRITISQIVGTGKGGQHKLTQLLNLVRSMTAPYVCVMDERGTHIMGHVKITDATQTQPAHRYTVTIEVTPTHSTPEPATVA